MTEGGETHEPRIARIRENLVDALGPFDVMAAVIARSQHGPDSSGLFGVAQSPVTPYPRPSRNAFNGPEFSNGPTTAQMLQSMQSLVDSPLTAIETNLPFKKVQDKKVMAANKADSPSTSAEGIDKRNRISNSRQRDDDDARRKRKRKRSGERTEENVERECENRDWQKPCSSGVGSQTRETGDDGHMTINDLFGDEKKRGDAAGKTDKRDNEETRKEERKGARWKKEEGESPDSGFVDETGDSDREHLQHTDLESIIEDFGRVSPILSPPQQPSSRLPPLTHNDGVPSLKCVMDVSALQLADRRRLQAKLSSLDHATILPPRPMLSPPRRPSSKAGRSPCCSDRTASPKPPPSSDAVNSTDGTPKRSGKESGAVKRRMSPSPSSSRKEILKKEQPSSRVASPVSAVLKEGVEDSKERRFVDFCFAKKDAKENLAMPASPMPSAKEKMKERCKDGPKASPQRVASPVLSKEREKNKEKQKNKEKLKDVNKEKKNEEEGRSRSEKEKAQQEKEKERTREVVRNKVKETKERPSSVFKNENRGSAKETTCKEEEEPRLKKERREENVAKRERNDQYNKKEKKEEMAEVFEASKKNTQRPYTLTCRAENVTKQKVEIEKNEDGSRKSATFYQNDMARSLKHKADDEAEDKVRKVLLYIESVVYFIYSVAVQIPNRDARTQGRHPYGMLRDTAELLKNTTNRFTDSRSSHIPLVAHFVSRVKLLSARAQSVLNFHLYTWRSREALKNFGALTKYERQNAEKEAVARRGEVGAGSQSARSAATPSPASSTHSANVEKAKEITIPLSLYQMQKEQLVILHHLMWADRIWRDSNALMTDLDREMVERLDDVCGQLSYESNLFLLSEYLATGVSWLRAEYELEKDADEGQR